MFLGAVLLRPDYHPSDYDRRLTSMAKTALPIIAAIRKYHVQKGDYPDEPSKLAPLLPKARIDKLGQDIDGWHYYRAPNSDGFSLSFPLGWDPTLEYQFDGRSGTWTFDPGDGSPVKPLKLKP